MPEALLFVVDLALVLAAGGFALTRSSVAGRLAAGLYSLVTGLALWLVPAAAWEVARTDNAFLGLYLLALLALGLGAALVVMAALRLRGRARRPAVLVPAAWPAAVAAAAAVALLAVRGPAAWATGSGQFGLDVVVIDVALGVAAFVVASRLARGGPAASRLRGR